MTANFSSKRKSCPIIKLQPCGPCGSVNQLRRASSPGPGLIGGYFTVGVTANCLCELEGWGWKGLHEGAWGLLAHSSLWLGSAPALSTCLCVLGATSESGVWDVCLGSYFTVLNRESQLFLLSSALITSPSSSGLKTKVDLSWI